jgi:hypothetical protein
LESCHSDPSRARKPAVDFVTDRQRINEPGL